MKKLKLTRAFLMTAIIFGGITTFAGNSYASGYYGAGNRTDNTTESINSDGGYFGAGNRSGYLGAGDRSGYAGAGNRTDNATVTETGTDDMTIGTIFSDIITVILG